MSNTQHNLMQLMLFSASMSALLGFASLLVKSVTMEVKMKMQINVIEMLAGFGCARSLVTTQKHKSRMEELKVVTYQGCPVREVRFLSSSPYFNLKAEQNGVGNPVFTPARSEIHRSLDFLGRAA